MSAQIKYIDLFAGIGGFHLGLTRASDAYTCVYSNEWDKYANSIYKQHFGECDDRDISSVDSNGLPDFDLLCGGFPCQAFSVAGKRAGFDDTRGTMFFEIARIARDKRPRYLLLENVKGLLTHDNGKTFQTILGVLADLGYHVQWQVLNSKNFGVPQNRERVFIIGHLGGEPRPEVFPLTESDRRDNETQGNTQSEGQRLRSDDPQVATTLAARDYKGGGNLIQLNQPNHSNDRVYDPEGVSPTLNTMQGGNRQPFVAIPVLTPDRIEKRQNGRRFKEDGEPSFTLTAQDRHGVMIYDDYNSNWRKDDLTGTLTPNTGSPTPRNGQKVYDGMTIRRLTPTECERLQGFPDGWTLPLSDTQRYKTLGNAVTVNVIEVIGRKLLDSIYKNMLLSNK